MRRGCALLEGERHADHFFPLLLHNVEIGGLGEQGCEHPVVDKPINPIQLLILEIPDTRHKVEPQQVTQGKDILGEAEGIRRMLPNFQNRVVVKQTIKDIESLARATGNDLRAEDGILVGDVGVDADGLLVITVVSRVIRSQEAAGPHAKALGIR